MSNEPIHIKLFMTTLLLIVLGVVLFIAYYSPITALGMAAILGIIEFFVGLFIAIHDIWKD
jgi:uncharacterized membrane protein